MTVKPFGVLLIASIALALAGCKKQEQDPRTLTPIVRLATVHAASTSDQLFTGVVTARVQSDLGFRVPGKVIRRYVDTGQVVRKGQPLMQIDVTDYAHAITNQEENVAAAKAPFAEIRSPLLPWNLLLAGFVQLLLFGDLNVLEWGPFLIVGRHFKPPFLRFC